MFPHTPAIVVSDPAAWLETASWCLLGLLVLLAAIAFRGRAKNALWCRRCDYDLSACPEGRRATCPECGRDPRLNRRPGRRRLTWLLILAAVLAPIPLAQKVWLEPAADWVWAHLLPTRVLFLQEESAGVPLRWYIERGERKAGPGNWNPRYSLSAKHPASGWIGLVTDQPAVWAGERREPQYQDSQPVPPRDVTGDGKDDIIVMSWSGGAHCCMTLTVLDPADAQHPLYTIDCQHSDEPRIEDVDGDGIAEILTNDWTWAYWNTSFASSTAPSLILSCRHGRVIPRADLMRSPPPSREELTQLATQYRASLLRDESLVFWDEMLKLLYSGNPGSAWEFFDLVWPDSRPGKAEFRAEFLESLSQSPWWPQLDEEFHALAKQTPEQVDPTTPR